MDTGETSRPWVCRVCGKRFTKKKNVKAHVLTHTDTDTVYSCDKCEKTYKNIHSLTRHKKYIHDNPDAFACDQCDKRFTGQYDLTRHLQRHAGKLERPWVCKICRKRFTCKSHVEMHTKTHFERPASSDEFKCSICGKQLAHKGSLTRHVKSVHGETTKSHQCPHCLKYFKQNYTLTLHLQLHSDNPRPWKCNLCQKSFTQRQSLKEHQAVHIGTLFACSYMDCCKSFSSEKKLKRHFHRSHVLMENKKYQCHLCKKLFSLKVILKSHLKRHDNASKIFGCELCPKRFVYRSDLKRHSQTHNRYCCQICSKTYGRRDTFASHLLKEHNIIQGPESDRKVTTTPSQNESFVTSRKAKSVKCNICKMSFPDKVKLKYHMTLHKSDQLFLCFSCDKSFNRKESLYIHRKAHPECQIVSQGVGSHVTGSGSHMTGSGSHMTGSESHMTGSCLTGITGSNTGMSTPMASNTAGNVTENVMTRIEGNETGVDESTVNEQSDVEIAVTLFPCIECDVIFLQEEHLLRHQTEHASHNLQELDHEESVCGALECPKCRKHFPSEEKLRSHLFMCNICD